jgi:hypothetical protein
LILLAAGVGELVILVGFGRRPPYAKVSKVSDRAA